MKIQGTNKQTTTPSTSTIGKVGQNAKNMEFFAWFPILLGSLVIIGCSSPKFSKDPEYKPCQESGQSCVNQNGIDYFTINEVVEGGKVDVLIVDDNSASMSYEQANLAAKFSNFIANLESKNVNYRIGITTTDISSVDNPARQINGDGAYQDGKLVPFPGGSKILTRDSGTLAVKDDMFKKAIQRNETLSCESFIKAWKQAGKSLDTDAYSAAYFTNCPSGDERGINAANLTLQNNPESFIRPEADLAVIVLSDEDVRSQLYYYKEPGFTLESLDTATSFINQMSSKYPTKKYAVHSIATIDSACLTTQNSQTLGLVKGSYGLEYVDLSNRSGGVVGSICSSDYAGMLTNIFNNVTEKIVDKIALACANPSDLVVSHDTSLPWDNTVTWTVVGKEIQFSKKLPVGAKVTGTYSCPSL